MFDKKSFKFHASQKYTAESPREEKETKETTTLSPHTKLPCETMHIFETPIQMEIVQSIQMQFNLKW